MVREGKKVVVVGGSLQFAITVSEAPAVSCSLYSAVEVTSVPSDVLHGKLSANDEGMWAAGSCRATVLPGIRAPSVSSSLSFELFVCGGGREVCGGCEPKIV